MGFDLSGMDPQVNKSIEHYTIYSKYEDKGWKKLDKLDKKTKDKYWEEYEEYHQDNPGLYFRNNVWWWRPLWDFVCNNCNDFMTDEQISAGSFNDGKEINQETAAKIGTKLIILLEDGTVERFEKSYEKERKAKDKEDFDSNYPFNKDNVKDFSEFCLQSGGFIIC